MSENHQIEKPRLFISPATSDGEFANAFKQELEKEKVFANGLEVFCTSSPGMIAVGSDWLSEMESRLSNAQVVIAIITLDSRSLCNPADKILYGNMLENDTTENTTHPFAERKMSVSLRTFSGKVPYKCIYRLICPG